MEAAVGPCCSCARMRVGRWCGCLKQALLSLLVMHTLGLAVGFARFCDGSDGRCARYQCSYRFWPSLALRRFRRPKFPKCPYFTKRFPDRPFACDKCPLHFPAVLSRDPIVTVVEPINNYHSAEPYHQQYLARGGRFGRPQSANKG